MALRQARRARRRGEQLADGIVGGEEALVVAADGLGVRIIGAERRVEDRYYYNETFSWYKWSPFHIWRDPMTTIETAPVMDLRPRDVDELGAEIDSPQRHAVADGDVC